MKKRQLIVENSELSKQIKTEVMVFPRNEQGTTRACDITKCFAKWDTGATHSSISSELAKKLSLAPVRKITYSHAGMFSDANLYIVNFILPSEVWVPDVEVMEIDLNESSSDDNTLQILIGMDVINRGEFILKNINGKTRFSFKMPITKKTDLASVTSPTRYGGRFML